MVVRRTTPSKRKREPAKKQARRRVPSIARKIAALGDEIPDAELVNVPTDSARNLDHYLYGAPKRP